jgi:hypothetical protein
VGSGCEPANQLWYVDLDVLPRGSDGALDLKGYDHFAKAGSKLPVTKVPLCKHKCLVANTVAMSKSVMVHAHA